MKKRYIIVPAACVALLVAIIVTVALVLDTGYLKKLSYDHVDSAVYNGVEVVGEDGLFYLVKEGQKLSRGYSSLQSVNEYYSEPLTSLMASGKSVELFDYYIARSAQDKSYLLVNSAGEEFIIEGDSYSLDTQSTALPYLVFTNNANGLKAVISLYRLDSDVSYKSGNELTLRTFREVVPMPSSQNDALCSYLVTENASDERQISYFRQDGIKITSGKSITPLSLYDEESELSYPMIYNNDSQELFSVGGECIATQVTSIVRGEYSDWRYAICHNTEEQRQYAVVFSPHRRFVLTDEVYDISTLGSFGSCMIAKKADGFGVDVINVISEQKSSYDEVVDLGVALRAKLAGIEFFSYLDESGRVLQTTEHSDMLPAGTLSNEHCVVFESQTYNSEHAGTYLHFARAGENVCALRTDGLSVSELSSNECASYLVSKTDGQTTLYSVLTPFSAIKQGGYYDDVQLHTQNGVSWILAKNYTGGSYDIIDPLTSKVVLSFPCAGENFAKYAFSHVENVALATDGRDPDSAVHMSIVTLSKYQSDSLVESVRYFAVYRASAYADSHYGKSALNVTEIGTDLLIDNEYVVFTDMNYLIAHTATGSRVYSIDETYELVEIAQLPYRATKVIRDSAAPEKDYFVVSTDSGMQGLYTKDSEEVLAPYYSQIKHAENGYFLVGMRGAWGVISAQGNGESKVVIDFLYLNIEGIGDNGYFATTGEGDTVVYFKGKKVLDESVQSVKRMYSFSTDEDGRLYASIWYLISSDGDLYIHRSEQTLNFTFGEYDGCERGVQGSLSTRAKVIYYYRGSSLVHTEVIYAEQSFDSLYSLEGVDAWYLTRNAADQTLPVTVQDLHDRHIIKLYAKTVA